jgi:type II secretory pathway component PulK
MKRMFRSHLPSQRGTALILVFWCLLLMGMAIFGVVEMVQLSVEHTSWQEDALQARALAASGVALGLNTQLQKDDPLLVQKTADGGQFKVAISSEGARLNLNFVLLSEHREILVNLFRQWGLEADQADHVANCLYDWVTPGDVRSLNGAKAEDYANAGLKQRPTYQPFVSLDEVDLVMGMDLLDKARPNWRDSFTLWSNGPLNVNEAPPDLIAAVLDYSPKRTAFFAKVRNGRDGIAGTADDVPVADLATFQRQLGISDSAMEPLASQISFSDPTRRIESVGQAGGSRVMISVVSRLDAIPIHYFLWSEH